MTRAQAILLLCLACASDALGQTTRPFLHPDRIRYDSQCLTIDGKDVFIYSGAFHYFRCPKELWRDRFQKIKEAGFNTVETYAPWNWHERQMSAGLHDFSKLDLTDLDDWLAMAEEFGFYIIVRPGPYICAEWDTGGFPQWLLNRKPEKPLRDQGWLRSDDPVYLDWCRHWYDAVCPVIARHQITRLQPGRPGVVLVQLENEYNFAGFSAEVMLHQVKFLAQTARANGIDVPLFTCWTHPVRGQTDPVLRQVFDACNFYPLWKVDEIQKDIQQLRREQPDAPLATTELQGGWFSKVGGALSEDQDGLTAAQINNLTLFAIQNGETILNYYMLFGGANPGDWAARDLTTSYDYNAPIREWGGVGERYQRVRALGEMLREHGARLSRSQAVECDVKVPQSDVTVVTRRAHDGSRYLFVRTSQHLAPREGVARVRDINLAGPEIVFDYHLEPFGSKVLYLPAGESNAARGIWLPAPPAHIEKANDPPAGVAITSAWRRIDPGPSHWKPLRSGQFLAQLGIYDSRFLYYQTSISNPPMTNLSVEYPSGDAVLATINGVPVAPMAAAADRSTFGLSHGLNQVEILYENHGHANGGLGMEHPSGILSARLIKKAFGPAQPIPGWRMRKIESLNAHSEIQADFADDHWPPVSVEKVEADTLEPGEKAIFRVNIVLTNADFDGGKKILQFGRIDDRGWVYVNGTNVGASYDWSQPCAFNATAQLHPGRNSIAVIVQNDAGAGGLGAPAMAEQSDDAPVPLEFFGEPAGVERQWWKTDLDNTSWTAVNLPDGERASSEQALLLTWYRLNFHLNPTKPGLWIPWRLRLQANGNGFLYLNGHPLGRYWQAGPQHDFFLPDCWLHSDRPNVLTINLRPAGKGASILSAVIEPYGIDNS